MKYSHLFALALLSFSTAACTSTYDYQNMAPPSAQLNSKKSVLISVPKNGRYETTVYENSGEMTADIISNAFSNYSSKVAVTKDCQGSNCLKLASNKKHGYYVEPKILHWEDRATEWSGKLDRIEVEISIYDIKTQKKLDSSSFKASSKWASFGGDHPQDLLHDPIMKYVRSLYKAPSKK